jgi:hypothetical protein
LAPALCDSGGGVASRRPARLLVHCLQSGGCSLFMYLLAQRSAKTMVMIDLWVDKPIPTVADFSIAEGRADVDLIAIKASRGRSAAPDISGWSSDV